MGGDICPSLFGGFLEYICYDQGYPQVGRLSNDKQLQVGCQDGKTTI
jgi:hypothetical protein